MGGAAHAPVRSARSAHKDERHRSCGRDARRIDATSFYTFVRAGARRGSCAGLRRFGSSNFGVLWSRARALAWSASGSGTPPRGTSGEERGCPGPGPPPPSESEGPGEELDLRYSRPGTSISATTPRKNKNGRIALAASSDSDNTFSRAAPTRTAINAGRAREASAIRTQKCDRLCLPEPQAIQSATSPSSKKTTIMITPPTLPER